MDRETVLSACKLCADFRSSVRKDMERHVAIVHGDGNYSTWICAKCQNRFYDFDHFLDHTKTTTSFFCHYGWFTLRQEPLSENSQCLFNSLVDQIMAPVNNASPAPACPTTASLTVAIPKPQRHVFAKRPYMNSKVLVFQNRLAQKSISMNRSMISEYIDPTKMAKIELPSPTIAENDCGQCGNNFGDMSEKQDEIGGETSTGNKRQLGKRRNKTWIGAKKKRFKKSTRKSVAKLPNRLIARAGSIRRVSSTSSAATETSQADCMDSKKRGKLTVNSGSPNPPDKASLSIPKKWTQKAKDRKLRCRSLVDARGFSGYVQCNLCANRVVSTSSKYGDSRKFFSAMQHAMSHLTLSIYECWYCKQNRVVAGASTISAMKTHLISVHRAKKFILGHTYSDESDFYHDDIMAALDACYGQKQIATTDVELASPECESGNNIADVIPPSTSTE